MIVYMTIFWTYWLVIIPLFLYSLKDLKCWLVNNIVEDNRWVGSYGNVCLLWPLTLTHTLLKPMVMRITYAVYTVGFNTISYLCGLIDNIRGSK